MGEDKKGDEGNKEGEKKEEVNKEDKKEEKKEEESIEIVLKVDMHCEACARKVTRSLKGFQGVEEVRADYKGSKVVVKGNKSADPLKVCQRVQKKSGRKVELISPIPNPPEEDQNKQPHTDPPKEEKKDEAASEATVVVLKVQMHCEACAQVLHKRIKKIKGVELVMIDLGGNQVTVKGIVDPDKLVSEVYKKTKKQVSVVKDEEKKQEEEKKEVADKNDNSKEECEKSDDKVEAEEETKNEDEIKKSEYLPPKYNLEYAYAYHPHIFSDENPHACVLM